MKRAAIDKSTAEIALKVRAAVKGVDDLVHTARAAGVYVKLHSFDELGGRHRLSVRSIVQNL
jgi:hypothetical protein